MAKVTVVKVRRRTAHYDSQWTVTVVGCEEKEPGVSVLLIITPVQASPLTDLISIILRVLIVVGWELPGVRSVGDGWAGRQGRHNNS